MEGVDENGGGCGASGAPRAGRAFPFLLILSLSKDE